ncbi:MAG: efflux RND transporter periplasmic adaptor subunit [Candidatus Roizmanbacteria bacterium]|nr:efflux RND transporter periplasmic adaptor subunit [Candidatus Roizmanbacteria bacterium]
MILFMKKRWKRIVVLALVVVAIGGIYITRWNPVASLGKPKETTTTVTQRDLEQTISMSGNVDAEKQTILRFQVAGLLAWVGVTVGDVVEPGQVIATLDQRELQKKLKKTLNSYLDTRWDFEQTLDDNEKAYTGSNHTYINDEITRIVQQSQFGLDSSVIDVELADLNLQLSRLSTPIAGVVTRVDQPYAGVNITPAQAEFVVVDPTTLYLKAVVDQQDVISMHVGDRGTIILDAYPNESISGTITYIGFAPVVGEESSYEVRINLPSHLLGKVKMGMSAEVTVVTDRKRNALTVPIEAILEEGSNKKYVTVRLADGTNKKKRIRTGLETFEYVEVISGLKKGDVIVY